MGLAATSCESLAGSDSGVVGPPQAHLVGPGFSVPWRGSCQKNKQLSFEHVKASAEANVSERKEVR